MKHTFLSNTSQILYLSGLLRAHWPDISHVATLNWKEGKKSSSYSKKPVATSLLKKERIKTWTQLALATHSYGNPNILENLSPSYKVFWSPPQGKKFQSPIGYYTQLKVSLPPGHMTHSIKPGCGASWFGTLHTKTNGYSSPTHSVIKEREEGEHAN